MKPTDEERREVAARLRRLAEKHKGVPWFLIEKYLGLVSDEGFVAGSMFASECVLYLADLIEPEPERTCRAEQDYEAMDDGIPDCRIWRCECGEKFPFWRGLEPIYCPLCGAKVIEEES